MKIKVKKLNDLAKLPNFAHVGEDAGLDLYSVEKVVVAPMERVKIKTGIALEIPRGYVGLVWDKGGPSFKYGLKTYGGVVDSGYRGELLIGIINLSNTEYVFNVGDKIAQLLIQKFEIVEIGEVDFLEGSMRDEGAFGSTGK
jgi:dUTP pyrophosphatase